jgi:hypothetical protein
MSDKFLRTNEVTALACIGRSTLYELVARGDFPARNPVIWSVIGQRKSPRRDPGALPTNKEVPGHHSRRHEPIRCSAAHGRPIRDSQTRLDSFLALRAIKLAGF